MSKPAKTYREQLDILKTRGLLVHNEPFALHCLEHHNYYRLSPYRFPFTAPGNRDAFIPGTTFEQLWKLYAFDRKLRHLVIEACKSVEISLVPAKGLPDDHPLGEILAEPLFNGISKGPTTDKSATEVLRISAGTSRDDFYVDESDLNTLPWN